MKPIVMLVVINFVTFSLAKYTGIQEKKSLCICDDLKYMSTLLRSLLSFHIAHLEVL